MTLLNNVQKQNLTITRQMIIRTLDMMIKDTDQPRVRALYSAVKDNVFSVPINFRSGNTLESGFGFSTMGENIKRVKYIGNMPVLQSAIILPYEHFFSGNKISYDGLLTLLHEYSHIILPQESKYFVMDLLGIDDGEQSDEIDEFFADLIMTRIATRILLPDFVVGY